MDPSDSSFWEEYYGQGELPWDRGEAAPPLVRFIEAATFPPNMAALVPGCGLGHEALFLARNGFTVTAVDFAPSAVAELIRRSADWHIAALQLDFFDLPATTHGAFDLIVEHTCFCAVNRLRRDVYAEVAAAVLSSYGQLLGLFYEVDDDEGPPHRTTRDDVERHFTPYFDILTIERPHDSFVDRNGKEWLVHMRKKG